MTKTYKATGIILKGKPLGEADRLVTILTSEYGLIQAIAPNARKHNSQLRGRSELFVVNELLMSKGRSLDKILQAETVTCYAGLTQNYDKLIVSQYLAELTLYLALSEQPQQELFTILNEHLKRLEEINFSSHTKANCSVIFPYLTQAVFHLLAIAGICPQVHQCCFTQTPLTSNFHDPAWKVGFSFDAGGLIKLSTQVLKAEENNINKPKKINLKLGAIEVTLLQQLSKNNLPNIKEILPENINIDDLDNAWIRIEKMLRDYIQYDLNCKFRSNLLVDSLVNV